jgi:hypothetical protein
VAQVSKIFDATVVSIAMGDTTTLFLHEGNAMTHTHDLPPRLYTALDERSPDQPLPKVRRCFKFGIS